MHVIISVSWIKLNIRFPTLSIAFIFLAYKVYWKKTNINFPEIFFRIHSNFFSVLEFSFYFLMNWSEEVRSLSHTMREEDSLEVQTQP